MTGIRFEETAWAQWLELRKNPGDPFYIALRDAITALLKDTGAARARQRRFAVGLWGTEVRSGAREGLLLWCLKENGDSVLEIAYAGPAPGDPGYLAWRPESEGKASAQ